MESSTRMTDAWIAEAVRKNPVQHITTKNGEPTGNIRTCPVRLSFPKLFMPEYPMGAAKDDNGNDRKKVYSTGVLFPACADLRLLDIEIESMLKEKFPKYSITGLHKPIRDCGEKPNLGGYEEGWHFCSPATQYKPPIVDTRLAPIVDESRVYPGVWAICSINLFTFDAKLKRGVSVGLQSVMIIADDTKLGGTGSDVNVDLAGVSIEAPTDVASLM